MLESLLPDQPKTTSRFSRPNTLINSTGIKKDDVTRVISPGID